MHPVITTLSLMPVTALLDTRLEQRPPVIGFAAWSGVGKTTLLKQMLPLLCEQRLLIGIIKHAHHHFDIDHPGKDSFELRKAGAQQMLVTSNKRWALMVERQQQNEPRLDEHIEQLDYEQLDLILVEGFKKADIPKIELYRSELQQPLLFPDDDNIIAVATDSPLILPNNIVCLDINSPQQIADFIFRRFLD